MGSRFSFAFLIRLGREGVCKIMAGRGLLCTGEVNGVVLLSCILLSGCRDRCFLALGRIMAWFYQVVSSCRLVWIGVIGLGDWMVMAGTGVVARSEFEDLV